MYIKGRMWNQFFFCMIFPKNKLYLFYERVMMEKTLLICVGFPSTPHLLLLHKPLLHAAPFSVISMTIQFMSSKILGSYSILDLMTNSRKSMHKATLALVSTFSTSQVFTSSRKGTEFTSNKRLGFWFRSKSNS